MLQPEWTVHLQRYLVHEHHGLPEAFWYLPQMKQFFFVFIFYTGRQFFLYILE